jgi:hypothetical protein
MNLYYYLFYRLSCFLNKKNNNEWGPIGGLTFLIGLNIGLIYINIFPVTNENFKASHKTLLLVLFISLFIINSVLFLNKKRVQEIRKRFKNESIKSKRIGSILVLLYSVVTIVSIFFA